MPRRPRPASAKRHSGCTLLMQRSGRATRGVHVPGWCLRALSLTLLGALCACVLSGYYLQALAITGPSAFPGDEGRWALGLRWVQYGWRTEADAFAEERRQRARKRARRLGLGTRQTATQLLGGQVERAWMEAAGGAGHTPGTLLWPVTEGWYVRGYGSGEGGYHLAVDIMGERGAPVLASAEGIVGYAGNEVRGYGRIVLLIHPGGWVTMYAHNDAIYVAAGERVQRGQPIASLGNTGISRGPHVHYEFMHGGRNCDPAPLFRPGIRHRWGGLSDLVPARWMDPQARPRAVACDRRRRHPHSRYVAASVSPSDSHPPTALD